MKEKLSEERAIDTVGRPGVKAKSFGSSKGTSKKESMGESAKGVGGGLKADNTKDEPVFHESSYRDGVDKNFEKKAETGLPRQEASYQNRDRQGTGFEAEPVYQRKLRSYPSKGPATKGGSKEKDL